MKTDRKRALKYIYFQIIDNCSHFWCFMDVFACCTLNVLLFVSPASKFVSEKLGEQFRQDRKPRKIGRSHPSFPPTSLS